MKKLGLVTVMALPIAALVIGCGRPAPATVVEKPQTPVTLPSASPEDEQLLDEMRLCWLAVAQAQYDSGGTNLLAMHIQLERVEQARKSLWQLEEEKRRFLAAAELQYRSNQLDPFALNHSLQMIENSRQEILADITKGLY